MSSTFETRQEGQVQHHQLISVQRRSPSVTEQWSKQAPASRPCRSQQGLWNCKAGRVAADPTQQVRFIRFLPGVQIVAV